MHSKRVNHKGLLAALLLTMLLSGCVKVDTDPLDNFEYVKKEIEDKTCHTIYWDRALENSVQIQSVDTLLKEKLTDDFVVQVALLNNPSLQALYEELGIAKANLAQSTLLKNPIYSLAYRFSTKKGVTDLIDMGLVQNVLDILLIPLKKNQAYSSLKMTELTLTSKILHVIAVTKMAFYSLQALERIGKVKQEILLASELSYEVAQRLFQAGNIKDLRVSMEKASYEQAKLDLATLEVEILDAREKLNVLMGLFGRDIQWKLSEDTPCIFVEEKKYANIENESVYNSLNLRAKYESLLKIAAQFGVDTSRLIFPKLDIGASAEREGGVWYAGPSIDVSLPLFDFGIANAKKAESTILKQFNEYTALAIEIRSKARSFKYGLLNAYRQARYLDRVIVPLSKKITHATLLQHNAMQLGVFELLSAKKRELISEIQKIEKLLDYLIQKIKVETLLQGHVMDLKTGDLP